MDNKFSERLTASEVLFLQICGAVLKWWWLLLLTILSFLGILLPIDCKCLPFELWQLFVLLGSIFLLILVILACNGLTNIFSLLREEKYITNCQLAILVAIGLWIVGAIFILEIWNSQTSHIVFALFGGLLTWIFQDKVKGAVAFIHFRSHKLLKIGDWIKVPKLGVDGEIQKVTLTTVTLYNWDTTTSTIPMNALQSEHFTNLQNMSEGKTYGRRMLQKFTIDSGWIHPIDAKETKFLKSGKHHIVDYLPDDELMIGTLNIHLFRLYLYHWLMENDHVSQLPRLIVRWTEQNDSGVVLEVYTFLTDCDFSSFEWQQSRIIEHIIESMAWFGLRVYQSPSAYDASNSNIFITKSPANYKIKNK